MRGIRFVSNVHSRKIREANQAVAVRRDTREKITVSLDNLARGAAQQILDTIPRRTCWKSQNAQRSAHL